MGKILILKHILKFLDGSAVKHKAFFQRRQIIGIPKIISLAENFLGSISGDIDRGKLKIGIRYDDFQKRQTYKIPENKLWLPEK